MGATGVCLATDGGCPRWKYMQTFVIDGNFSAEHLKMRQPANDISIADGHGFMVTDGPYKQHLLEATEDRQVGSLLYPIPISRLHFAPSNPRVTRTGQ